MSGITSITNTTPSTTTTTGSLLISGGLGVAGQVTAATVSASTLSGTLSTIAQPNVTSVGTLTGLSVSGVSLVTNTTVSTTTTTGALRISGGVGVVGQLTALTISATTLTGTLSTPAQPNVTSVGTLTSLNVSGIATVSNTTQSTSTTTGALVVAGGAAFAKSVYLGGSVHINVKSLSANYTVTSGDNTMILNTSGGTFVVQLPSATGIIGRIYNFVMVTPDKNSVQITTFGSETIASSNSSWNIVDMNASLQIISVDNGNWAILASTGIINTGTQSGTIGVYFGGAATGTVDGNAIITSNTTLTRDMYYNNLTVNSSIIVNSNGWRIVVFGVLTLNGTIFNGGGDGTGLAAGSGAPMNYLGGGTNGATGRNSSGNGANGIASQTTGYIGGVGSSGGSAGSSLGGQGGIIDYLDSTNGGLNILSMPPYNFVGRAIGSNQYDIFGGTGGGSGGAQRGTALTVVSGGGGGGGGIIIVVAKSLAGSGTINANGGNGGIASFTGTSTTVSAGGGGGGGGGAISVIYATNLSTITFTASGGVGGTSVGSGTNGVSGATGRVHLSQA